MWQVRATAPMKVKMAKCLPMRTEWVEAAPGVFDGDYDEMRSAGMAGRILCMNGMKGIPANPRLIPRKAVLRTDEWDER